MCRKTTLTSNTHFLSTSVCTSCLHRSTLLVYTTFYLGNHVLSLLDEDIKAGCQTEISFSPPLCTALVNWQKSKRDDEEQSMAWPVIRGSFFFFFVTACRSPFLRWSFGRITNTKYHDTALHHRFRGKKRHIFSVCVLVWRVGDVS